MTTRHRTRIAALLTTAVLLLAACSSGSDDAGDAGDDMDTTTEAATSPSTDDTSADEPDAPDEPSDDRTAVYLSIGDSYAAGYGASDRALSFAGLLPDLLRERGRDLELVNLGCEGATTADLEAWTACPVGPAELDLDRLDELSQLDAAVDLLTDEVVDVQVVTVVIGGNDITGCAYELDDTIGCVRTNMAEVGEMLAPVLERLREAAGPDTVIIGLTYPDVFLGAWLMDDLRFLAPTSVEAFRDVINPELRDVYEAVDAIFVDVTDATDAYLPLDETVDDPERGELPAAVARVCELTFFCDDLDIHPNDEGYELIAHLIADAVPQP